MQQYAQLKSKYPKAILLFRVGDFYETFGEDAITTSQVLGIILTSRNNGGSDVELAGFPFHSLDLYLPRLVRAGYRVAICEQLEKPSPQKKLVKRGVTEVVTPGLAIDDQLLDNKTNNYLAALHLGKKEGIGVAFLDISTGEFLVSEGNLEYIEKLFQSFNPSEILFSKEKQKNFKEAFSDKYYTFPLEDWVFSVDFSREKLLTRFEVQNLKGFGVEDLENAQIAAGAILYYLEITENNNLKHLTSISRIEPERYVWLDRFTIRNLELLQSQHESGIPLLKILDQTISPMGARLLRKWVVLPLRAMPAIESRLDCIAFFLEQPALVITIERQIRQMGDLERLIAKVPLGKINPREVTQLLKALEATQPIKECLQSVEQTTLNKIVEGLNLCSTLCHTIRTQLVNDPPVNISKGGVIANGFNAELDELRHLLQNSKQILLQLQQAEAKKTGIDNLKIGFNSVFGYYLEVTNKYKDKGLIPAYWIRKQTLSNAERYITEELKTLEIKILGAEEKMLELESNLFEQLVFSLSDYIQPIQHNAAIIGRLDCLLSFTKVAHKNQYCRPEIEDSFVIEIKAGRHPVIEQQMPAGESYIPNDVYLDKETQQILMITGPNMSGKSALLRQTALICLMAQMGSYVPASSLKMGLIDKVFSRVGASDNISSGESTFMVEMNETASIMNNISDRSLILLDEIGRGTSTYDGISIAWSIAEYLHNNLYYHPKTLFATHYHELNELANKLPRIHNFHIATKEIGQKVIFMRQLVPGGSQHSFGIHVARMAGMPRSIVERATYILAQMEQKSIQTEANGSDSVLVQKPPTEKINTPAIQLSIFESADPNTEKLKTVLKNIQLDAMTPIECMMKLNELKKMIE